MTHLRRYLEEHGVLYPEQLAEAVRRQQIYGGSLDTVLLELELVDPVTLGELLERACGFPLVPPELLDNGLSRPWTEIPEDMQRSRWVEPLTHEGDEVLVAVHPDLPDDLLGRLHRNVRRVRPMVTPECCLEKVAAERNGSVVPQRYAVLCAAYISAVRRRPSVSGAFGVPGIEPAPPPSSEHAGASTSSVPADDLRPVAGSIDVVETAPMNLPAPAVPTAPAPATEVPAAEVPAAEAPVVSLRPAPDVVAAETSPPPQVTLIMHEEADVLRRLEQARSVLSASRSRDEALDAILRAAMVLSARVGLFRVRGNELVGLSTPHSHLPDIGGTIVSASEGSAAGIAMALGRFSGLAPEADLRLATGANATTPCVLQRVQVRERPVVFVYLDRDGAPIERRDLVCLGDLADLAGQVFEQIVKMRRQPGAAPAAEAPAPSAPVPTAAAPSAPVPSAPAPIPTPPLGQPPETSWGPAPSTIRATLGDDGTDETAEPPPVEPPPSRVSTPELEHPDHAPTPALVPSAVEPAPHDSWRLTPELAARALQEQARVVTPEPEPEPAPEPEPPAPEVTPPEPAPEVTPPEPAPEITPPEPAPEIIPPEPAPEIIPPAPEPEIIPPAPEPEVSPPMFSGGGDLPPQQRWDDVTQVVPRPLPEDDDEQEEAASIDEEEGVTVGPSQRPTVELPRLDLSKIPGTLTRETMEIYSPSSRQGASSKPVPSEPAPAEPAPAEPDSSEDSDESRPSLSRLTMHSSPPPPPLPPPPMSAVDEDEGEHQSQGGGRRARSPTIHGLPPPELESRSGQKRVGLPRSEQVLTGDEDDVTIISLAAPITPATARGRIELEDEDWVAPGSQLASDSQQGLIDAVIDAVVAGDAGVDQLYEHGDAALLRLMAQFPGPLEVLRRDLRALPPPSAHGPLVRTVIAVGKPVVPHIIDLLEHPNPDVRFYAAFVFHELRDARCMRPLAKLAFDTNGDVRVVSMRVLETYRRAEGFSTAAAVVREELDSEARSLQLHAARAAGTLRDIGAIPQLIELLASADRFIQEAALESLCSITGQQHGLKPHRWRTWYDEHGQRHRVEWIIDSLRHRDLPVRRWAADELVRITGQRVPFSPMGDKRAREVASKAWMDWWEVQGREMFGA